MDAWTAHARRANAFKSAAATDLHQAARYAEHGTYALARSRIEAALSQLEAAQAAERQADEIADALEARGLAVEVAGGR